MKTGEPVFKALNVRVRNLSVSEFAAQQDEMLAYVAPLGEGG